MTLVYIESETSIFETRRMKMKFINITKANIDIDGVPAIVLKPKLDMDTYPTVVFYHGWSSSKEH
jgi:fermentation-respiration switch protein FrsA (DUF1100 family)